MAPHSSTLAWKIPWMEEPGRLQSMGSLQVGSDWATSLSLSCTGEGNGTPLQCSCLENPRDGGAWWAAACGVVQSWTRLKRLSSSSSKYHANQNCSPSQTASSHITFPHQCNLQTPRCYLKLIHQLLLVHLQILIVQFQLSVLHTANGFVIFPLPIIQSDKKLIL